LVANALAGTRLLIMEDEFLIAMDIEQVCRDHGAEDIVIVRSLGELGAEPDFAFDAAVVDMRLGGDSTVDFASQLMARKVPFVFSTGYSDLGEAADGFPGVPVVTKPYNGTDLVEALAAAMNRSAGGR
jgi:DNA-binding response OmpR family regulator